MLDKLPSLYFHFNYKTHHTVQQIQDSCLYNKSTPKIFIKTVNKQLILQCVILPLAVGTTQQTLLINNDGSGTSG